MTKISGLEIDHRVGIALSALPDSQKSAVERVTRSAKSFAVAAATPGRVRQMRTSGQPLYMMRVAPSLRLVYTEVGNTAYVLDVVERATLNHFRSRKPAKKQAKLKGAKKSRRAHESL